MKNFKGIFTALLTPFDANDNVNTAELKKLVEWNLEKGVTGFYVAGSTGEAFLLSEEERRLVYATVKEAAGDRATPVSYTHLTLPTMAVV